MKNYKRNLSNQEERLKLKFIMWQIKNIITNRGRFIYILEADKVFKDIFLEKKFISRLIKSTNIQESEYIINLIGINTLHELLNTSSYVDILKSLISLTVKLDYLEAKIRKMRKKKKKIPKNIAKEYNFYKNLYKKSVKCLRKDLGLKTDIGYKKQFSILSKYSKGGKKNLNNGLDIFDDIDPIYDDDDFDDENDPYSDFLNYEMRKSRRTRKRNPQLSNNYQKYEDDDDEDFDEDDDDEDFDEDDDDEDFDERLSNIENTLRNINQYISSQNQSLKNTANSKSRSNYNTDEYEFYEDIDNDTHYNQYNQSSNQNLVMEKQIEYITKSIRPIAEAIDNIGSRLNDIENDLYESNDSEEIITSPGSVSDKSDVILEPKIIGSIQ